MPLETTMPLEKWLATQPAIILDGALATELERRGADLNDPLWSAKCLLEQPALIHAVHADYFAAGADVATTATYQATFEAFERRGMTRAAAAGTMRTAVRLAVQARDEFWAVPAHRRNRCRPLVAASIGPYGAMLADGSEYRGHYALSELALRDFHRPRFELLASSDADLLAFETLPCLREALVLTRLLEEFPALTAWVSFSCRDDSHTCEGEDVGDCASALASCPQIVAVGANCTRPEFMPTLLARMREHTTKPLVAYPNSGEDYDPSVKEWHGHAHLGSMATAALAWYASGARLIGGCCRTTPADIRSIRRTLFALPRHA